MWLSCVGDRLTVAILVFVVVSRTAPLLGVVYRLVTVLVGWGLSSCVGSVVVVLRIY